MAISVASSPSSISDTTISEPFDGTCYGSWRRSMLVALSVRNKLDFIHGTVEKPSKGSPLMQQWHKCNDLVVAWLSNSVTKQIHRTVVYSEYAKDIWRELETRYGQADRARCTCGGGVKAEEEQRIYQFLIRLNDVYVQVRSNIVMLKPLPFIDIVYSILLSDEKQRQVSSTSQFTSESTSFNAGASKPAYAPRVNFEPSKSLICKYCKKSGHSIEKCYKLHDFSPNFKFKKNDAPRRASANVVIESSSVFSVHSSPSPSTVFSNDASDQHSGVPGLTKEQYSQLMLLLQQSHVSPNPSHSLMASAHFAGRIATHNVLLKPALFSQVDSSAWILDSGASDHMTSQKSLLFNLEPLTILCLVSLPNGYKVKGPSLKKPLVLGKLDKGLYKLDITQSTSMPCSSLSVVSFPVIEVCSPDSVFPVDPSSPVDVFPSATSYFPSSGETSGEVFPSSSPSSSPPPCNVSSSSPSSTALPSSSPTHFTSPSPVRKHVVSLSAPADLSIFEPESYSQAVPLPEWQEAMRHEFEAFETNGIWSVMPLPPGKKPIGCKWVYKVKYKADGSVKRYKARLVVRGNTQVEDIDFQETFSHVVKMSTIKTLVALAVKRQWPLFQLDANNAFLHGDLDEEVFMKLPPGYSVLSTSGSDQLVCKLQKSFYGLRQALRQWYAKLSQALTSRGYSSSLNDYSLFIKGSGASLVILVVYVDDIVITGADSSKISDVKSFLHAQFKIKDLGCFSCVCPLELSAKLKAHGGDPLPKPDVYRSLIGKLNFLTHTRRDIYFVVQHLSQFMQSPCLPHMQVALHVLRYLKGTSDCGIFFNNFSDLSLTAYCDSDWVACLDTRKSVSGYCMFLGGSLVVWKSKKQHVISMSSAKAECRAMSKFVTELAWMSRLLSDLGLHSYSPISLFCDSHAAIHIAKNPVFHERTKHIELDCHLVRAKLAEGLIHLLHTSSSQLAGIFTKVLGGATHHGFLSKLGVLSPSNLRGGVRNIPPTPD
uniref:Retrovirus-related Pol polyprotein from transposon TNT 1-94 n=1 Tax=Nicotiana tabacum TaxID=4097 RepID=A0A1S4AXG5_TOBAC|nr:PREDICTED: uncharacterized protein LOC107802359 [Nicotiana tabacum]